MYLMLMPCVGDGWLSFLDDHQSLHVLKAGVRGHEAMERGLVVKRSSCNRYTHTHTHKVTEVYITKEMWSVLCVHIGMSVP